jgi:hypothetical protein
MLALENASAYDRQVLMFGSQGQAILQNATVGVVGLGGVGSLLVEYLSRLGVGTLKIVDNDRISPSNLSRVTGATQWDTRFAASFAFVPLIQRLACRYSSRKIDVARRIALRANPTARIERIFGDFGDDRIARKFLDCDFLFLAADTMRARLIFNAIVQQFYIPGIQIGSKIVADRRASTLEDAFSVVRWVVPRTNCLWCAGMISPHRLALEAKSEAEKLDQAYGVEEPNPSVITMNAVGAAQAANDFLMSFLGLHTPEVTVVPRRFKHLHRRVVEEFYPADQNCSECGENARSRLGRGIAVALPTAVGIH